MSSVPDFRPPTSALRPPTPTAAGTGYAPAALREALREQPESRALLVTMGDGPRDLDLPEGSVEIVPVWHYLLEGESNSP